MARKYYCDRCNFEDVQGVPGASPLVSIMVAGEQKELCPECNIAHEEMHREAEAAFDVVVMAWLATWTREELPFADPEDQVEVEE